MRLVKVTLEGFRRFLQPSILKVDHTLVALIGPNESGKTTLLNALMRLGDNDSWDPSDFHSDYSGQPEDPVLTARFLLESSDLELVKDFALHPHPRTFTVTKNRNGQRQFLVDPTPELEPQPREDARQALSTLLTATTGKVASHESPWLERLIAARQGVALKSLQEALEAVHPPKIPTYVGELNEVIALLRAASNFNVLELPNPAEEFIKVFERFRDHEAVGVELTAQTGNRLSANLPLVLFFDDPDRALSARVDVRVGLMERSGLANLLYMGGTSVAEVKRGTDPSRNHHPEDSRVRSVLHRCNLRINRLLREGWQQSNLSVDLQLNGVELLVRVTDNVTEQQNPLEQRSAGLRQFLALIAFVHRYGKPNPAGGLTVHPILLLDEAETHLHYAAQADMVRVLASQDIAKQVIYSTHSPGCLPDDLGGLRAIVPEEASGTSRIDNHLWSGHAEGFSRLFVRLGAKAYTFSAARAALISEGECDFLLLPYLLREALGRDQLGFQVLPGFSQASDGSAFEREAARVAYLFDGDAAGKNYMKKAVSAGVEGKRLFILEEGCALEDYLDPTLYLAGVNAELARHHSQLTLTHSDLEGTNPALRVIEVMTERGLSLLSKPSVLERTLEGWFEMQALGTGLTLLNPARTAAFRELAGKIDAVLRG